MDEIDTLEMAKIRISELESELISIKNSYTLMLQLSMIGLIYAESTHDLLNLLRGADGFLEYALRSKILNEEATETIVEAQELTNKAFRGFYALRELIHVTNNPNNHVNLIEALEDIERTWEYSKILLQFDWGNSEIVRIVGNKIQVQHLFRVIFYNLVLKLHTETKIDIRLSNLLDYPDIQNQDVHIIEISAMPIDNISQEKLLKHSYGTQLSLDLLWAQSFLKHFGGNIQSGKNNTLIILIPKDFSLVGRAGSE